ncbi:MAG: hypothetical protein ACRDY7_13580 [Acidimicrobiia bacterium]
MRRGALLAGLLAIWWPAAPAGASWASTAAGPGTAQSTTISAPSGLSSDCGLGLLSAKVTLAWTATSTSWADGYEVRWGTAPGAYSHSGTPSPASATSFTSPNLAAGTYYFVVRATKGNWRSAHSNEVSRGIGLLGCVL